MKFKDEWQFLYFFHRILSVDADFTNFTIEGLSSYKVNSFTYKLYDLKARMNITWPLVIVNATHYTVSNTSKIFGYDICGDGKMKYLFLSKKFNPFHTNGGISIPINFYLWKFLVSLKGPYFLYFIFFENKV